MKGSKKSPRLCRFCHKSTGNKSRICDTCWRLSAPLRDPSERGAKAWLEWKKAKEAKKVKSPRTDSQIRALAVMHRQKKRNTAKESGQGGTLWEGMRNSVSKGGKYGNKNP